MNPAITGNGPTSTNECFIFSSILQLIKKLIGLENSAEPIFHHPYPRHMEGHLWPNPILWFWKKSAENSTSNSFLNLFFKEKNNYNICKSPKLQFEALGRPSSPQRRWEDMWQKHCLTLHFKGLLGSFPHKFSSIPDQNSQKENTAVQIWALLLMFS